MPPLAPLLMAAQLMAAGTAPPLTPEAQRLVDTATDALIAGEDLPREYPVHLQALPPDQRLLVIVHLRRAGFLRDVVMPVDWVISPAAVPRAHRGGR